MEELADLQKEQAKLDKVSPEAPADRAKIAVSIRGMDSFGDPDTGELPEMNHAEGILVLPQTSNPQANSLEEFEKAINEGVDPIVTYSKLRNAHRFDDSFYLSASAILRKNGHAELVNRVLSNIVEENQPRAASFRKWAFALARIGEWGNAAVVLRQAVVFFPDDQLLAFDQGWITEKSGFGKPSQFWTNAVLTKTGNGIAAGIAAAFLINSEGGMGSPSTSGIEESLPVDLRIVITNASDSHTSYQMIDPAGFKTPYGRSWSLISPVGGRLLQKDGVAEFLLKDAMPGDYTLSVQCKESDLLRLEIYRNWGRENRTREDRILTVNGNPDRQELFTYSLHFEK